MSDTSDLVKQLINIPSPNPPGGTHAIAEFIAAWMSGTGASVRVLAPPEKPEAPSVVAVLGDGAPVVMLHAHIDTVPVASDERERWTTDPFTADERDGRVYGKGSVDDKGPLAAMMIAFRRLAAKRSRTGTLVLVAAAEEETGGQLGTRWLTDAGHLPASDFIIVGEQTGNRVATAHKGVMRATVSTRGRSVHATNPDRGVNAITAMARVVLELEAYHRRLAERSHPLVGTPTCNVGVIDGGSTANAVPDSCTVRLDRRMIPGEHPDAVREELRDVVRGASVAPASAEVTDFLFSSPFESKLATTLGRAFLDVTAEVAGGPRAPIGYLPGSDAKHLVSVARGDMVIFGPGSYEEAHAADEYVSVAELDTCEAVIERFLERALVKEGAYV